MIITRFGVLKSRGMRDFCCVLFGLILSFSYRFVCLFVCVVLVILFVSGNSLKHTAFLTSHLESI